MPTASVNGVDLYFEVRGSGPRLLLFNGSGTSVATSAPLIDRFAAEFEVLVHDHRFLGRSTVPSEPPTLADWAADGAALLDHLGWPSANVFGISFGGMVALEFAVTWSQRVERLAVACTSAGGEGGSSYPLHTIADLPPAEQDRLRLHLADSRYTPEFLAAHPFEERRACFPCIRFSRVPRREPDKYGPRPFEERLGGAVGVGEAGIDPAVVRQQDPGGEVGPQRPLGWGLAPCPGQESTPGEGFEALQDRHHKVGAIAVGGARLVHSGARAGGVRSGRA